MYHLENKHKIVFNLFQLETIEENDTAPKETFLATTLSALVCFIKNHYWFYVAICFLYHAFFAYSTVLGMARVNYNLKEPM